MHPNTGRREESRSRSPGALLSVCAKPNAATNSGSFARRRTGCSDILRSLPRVALQVADQRADGQSPQRVSVPFVGQYWKTKKTDEPGNERLAGWATSGQRVPVRATPGPGTYLPSCRCERSS